MLDHYSGLPSHTGYGSLHRHGRKWESIQRDGCAGFVVLLLEQPLLGLVRQDRGRKRHYFGAAVNRNNTKQKGRPERRPFCPDNGSVFERFSFHVLVWI